MLVQRTPRVWDLAGMIRLVQEMGRSVACFLAWMERDRMMVVMELY